MIRSHVIMWKAFLFGSFLILSFLIGCVKAPPPKNDTVVIWHWMTDRHKVFEQLAQQYKDETGINVIFQLYAPSDVYSQKIIAAAQARLLPDIYGILDKKSILASFIESGFVTELTEEFEKNDGAWKKNIFPKALAVSAFDEGNVFKIKPGIYGVPVDVTNIQMLYNKDLLKKAGIEHPPQTFQDFLNASASLKRVGVASLVSGWGEVWMIDCFASNYAFNIMGEDKIMATYLGEVPYTDPD